MDRVTWKNLIVIGIIVSQTLPAGAQAVAANGPGQLYGFSAIAKINQRVVVKGGDGSTMIVDNNSYTGDCLVRYPDIICPETRTGEQVNSAENSAAETRHGDSFDAAKAIVATNRRLATLEQTLNQRPTQQKRGPASAEECTQQESGLQAEVSALRTKAAAADGTAASLSDCKDKMARLSDGLTKAEQKVASLERQLNTRNAALRAAARILDTKSTAKELDQQSATAAPASKPAGQTDKAPALSRAQERVLRRKNPVSQPKAAPAPQQPATPKVAAPAPQPSTAAKNAASTPNAAPAAAPSPDAAASSSKPAGILSRVAVSSDGKAIDLDLKGVRGKLKLIKGTQGGKVIEISNTLVSAVPMQQQVHANGIEKVQLSQSGSSAMIEVIPESGSRASLTLVALTNGYRVLVASVLAPSAVAAPSPAQAEPTKRSATANPAVTSTGLAEELSAIVDANGKPLRAFGWQDIRVALSGNKAILKVPSSSCRAVEEQLSSSIKLKLADGPYTYYVLDKKSFL